jgi:GDPmannose 4,6-dehydratase
LKTNFRSHHEARRDWGYSADYVKAIWLMLQQNTQEDYVIATGKTHSVKDLVELTFEYVGLNWKDFVFVDEKLYRPAEVHELKGDFNKAKRKLGWQPTMSFEDLIKTMIERDLESLKDKKFNM